MPRSRPSRHPPLLIVLLGPLLAAAATVPVLAAPSVYARMAQADLVVHVHIVDGTLRLAECRVVQVLKGKFERPMLYVAFRADNMMRERWRDRIVFENGTDAILLLTSVVDAENQMKAGDRFRLAGGFLGKIDLPREGAQAYVQAVQRLAGILEMGDIHQKWAAHRRLIQETNPYLVEAGFEQILKFRLGNPAMVGVLLDHLESPHDRFRRAALDVLAQVFSRVERHGAPLGNEDHVVARVLTAAMEDPAPAVRVCAVRALHAYGKPDVLAALQEVARSDPSQDVRYQATVSVYKLNRYRGETGTLLPDD